VSSESRKLLKPTPTSRSRRCGSKSTRSRSLRAISVSSSQEKRRRRRSLAAGKNPIAFCKIPSDVLFRIRVLRKRWIGIPLRVSITLRWVGLAACGVFQPG
jgi:hypothetical protein